MENKKLEDLVKQYEEAQAENKIPYLDATDYLDIANYYWVKKKDEEALTTLANALHIHPGNEDLVRTQIELYIDTGEIGKAREIMNNANCRSSAAIRYLDAELHFEEGDTDGALIILHELYDINTDPDVFADMAELYMEMDNKDAAVNCLEMAIKISPENMEIIVPLATTLCEIGKYKKAIKYLNRIIDDDPYSFLAWIKIGESYLALEQYDKAIEAAEFAMIASPENELSYFIRGQAYFSLSNYEKALEDINKIRNLDTVSLSFISYFKGLCYVHLENFEEAQKALKKALAEMEETGETEEIIYYQVLLYLFKSLYELGRFEEAESYMKRLPMDVSDIETVTKMLKDKANGEDYPEDDIESLEKITVKNDTAENWYNLGIAYLEQKRFAEAVGSFMMVMQKEPDTKGLALNMVLAYIGNNEPDEIRKNIEFIKKNLKESHPDLKMEVSEDKVEELIKLITDMFGDFFNS